MESSKVFFCGSFTKITITTNHSKHPFLNDEMEDFPLVLKLISQRVSLHLDHARKNDNTCWGKSKWRGFAWEKVARTQSSMCRFTVWPRWWRSVLHSLRVKKASRRRSQRHSILWRYTLGRTSTGCSTFSCRSSYVQTGAVMQQKGGGPALHGCLWPLRTKSLWQHRWY